MTHTITGTYTTLVTLNAAIDNPTTITTAGRLNDGLRVTYQGLTVVNAGSIAGSFAGIDLYLGGSVTNQSGGAIYGANGIYVQTDAATVVNAGRIAGNASNIGIFLKAGGSVTNQSGGAISGIYGIFGGGGAVTVVNAGTITGNNGAVMFAAGFADRLVIDPDAVFSGNVTGGNAIGAAQVSTLELASASSAGTLSGLSTQFVDFAQVTVDAGAQWTLAGANTIAAGVTLSNAGTLTDAGRLTNAGTLSGELTLAPSGVLSNASTGTVTASDGAAVYGAAGGVATVVNAGVIADTNASAGRGIDLTAGGSVTNQSGGAISGKDGIVGYNAPVTVVNAGSIVGSFVGVQLYAGGSVTNQSGGSISGADGIVGGYAAVTVVNAGSIAGSGYGVFLSGGGSVTNQGGGAITGGIDGIFGSDAAVTVVNAGTISGSGDAVNLLAGYANRLIIDPNAVFDGTVTGGNAMGAAQVSTLELASGASAGTLSGLGTKYVDFAQVTVDAGAQWTLAGANTLAAGYTLTDAGTLTNAGTLSAYSALTLAAGGVLSNASTGTITVSDGTAVYGAAGGAATVVNAGVIAGDGEGIVLEAAGSVTNQSGGAISGGTGIVGEDAAVTVVNAGSIAGSDFGVYLNAGGSVTNQSGGSISSGKDGIVGYNATVTVVNAGSIVGSLVGVQLYAGGSVTNQSGGSISGADGIVGEYATVTVVNVGSIAGSGYGVFLSGGGSVTNQSGGAITGGIDGIFGSDAAVTVVNAGTISGSGDAVKFAAGYANRLVIDPGAVFSGEVTGGNAIGAAQVSTLELASAGSAGTLSGLGTQFVDFAQVTVDSGAQWTLTGADTIAAGATLTDAGILTNAGTLTNGGTLSGALTLAAGGVLSNASTGTITMSGGPAVYGATGGAATIVNAGVIAGSDASGGLGIDLTGGGSVTNQSGGTISGNTGFDALVDPATIVNAGLISGNPDTTADAGVLLTDGGSVINQLGGTISGYFGIWGKNVAFTVVNAGTIAGDTAVAPSSGVLLNENGSVTNQVGGVISGYKGIYDPLGTATVVNAGTIEGLGASHSYGIEFSANTGGGNVTNQSGGVISGINGVEITDHAVLVNAGTIRGNATTGEGVLFGTGGNVTNQAGGEISGAFGVRLVGAAGTVVNAGSIIGGKYAAIYLNKGGSVTNQSGGVFSGKYGVENTSSALTLVNAGSIAGGSTVGAGILLDKGGSVTNQSGGAISGFVGINGKGAVVTVVNAGTIIGGSYAVKLTTGFANRLVIDPGAVFSGQVTGGNAIGAAHVSTLELASVGSVGTLSGLGTQFTDFAQVTVDAGAQWVLTGGNTLAKGDTITNAGTLTLSNATLSGAAGFINNGAIVLDPSSMTIGSLTGSGSVTIEAGSTLDVTGAIASTETIVFAGSGASLLLGTPDSAAGAVTGFAAGDTIDLVGIAPASVSDAGGTVSFTGGSFPLAASISLVIEPDGNGGTDIVSCFADGTRIATPEGSVRVEALRAGDRVLTASGDVRPVRWVGCRTVDLARHPAPGQVQPIRIAAGAFAEGVPSRALRLSPDHAVLLHGLLIPIKLLRNDASITRETACRSVTYYHVELDAHDILLAEGLAAESYLDTGNRAMFANAGRPVLLHPDLSNDQARREMESCAPFADQPTVVEPMWRTLAARAEQMGLPVPPMAETTDDPALHLMVDGHRCAPVTVAHGCYTFLIARNASEVRLVSRHAVRSDTAPWVADSRRLGVQLGEMTIRCGGAVVPVPLDHPLLADGWWQPEWHAATTLRRWTKGDAVVPEMAVGPGPLVLEVEVAATVPYPFPYAAKEAGTRRVISMAV